MFGGLLLIASIFLSEGLPLARALAADQRPEYAVRVGLAILGLVHVEQLYRRAHPQARWGIKPLAVSLAAMFGFDLFLFAGRAAVRASSTPTSGSRAASRTRW